MTIIIIIFINKAMLADYVMKGIDSLFSEKLYNHQSAITKHNANANKSDIKPKLTKELIKNSLHSIIRKDVNASKSPKSRFDRSPSPISKSRLKAILESNKEERIKSVVKRSENKRRETSPYKNIESPHFAHNPRQTELNDCN